MAVNYSQQRLDFIEKLARVVKVTRCDLIRLFILLWRLVVVYEMLLHR